MSNSFNRNVVFLSDYPETVYDCSLRQADHKNIFIFYFSTYSREINDIFYHLKKKKRTITSAFSRAVLQRDLSNFRCL